MLNENWYHLKDLCVKTKWFTSSPHPVRVRRRGDSIKPHISTPSGATFRIILIVFGPTGINDTDTHTHPSQSRDKEKISPTFMRTIKSFSWADVGCRKWEDFSHKITFAFSWWIWSYRLERVLTFTSVRAHTIISICRWAGEKTLWFEAMFRTVCQYSMKNSSVNQSPEYEYLFQCLAASWYSINHGVAWEPNKIYWALAKKFMWNNICMINSNWSFSNFKHVGVRP